MLALVFVEILSVPAGRSRGRHNPRVVKRKMSNFPTRSRATPVACGRLHYQDHVRIVPPAVPEPDPAAAAPSRDRPKPIKPGRLHLRHVRDWNTSGMSRADYCRHHRLDPRAFNQWVASARNQLRKKTSEAVAKP
jgi:hypothetical protein